ncbi:MAG TPA: tetratricopeptide repeat protein [Bryobacteraceae bacterium]|nr:tetratricopeptide repeat protein [Bryobacteraceae bacterium]
MDPVPLDCDALSGELLERYVANRLSEEDRSRVEEHYFSCPRCLDRVSALQAVRSALEERGVATSSGPPVRERRISWVWPSLAAAAAVVIAIAAVLVLRPRPAPPVARNRTHVNRRSLDLTELARIDPPRYSPPTLRGMQGSEQRRFRAAMKLYGAGDYRGAIPELRSLAESDPGNFDALFFLGAADLLTGNTRQGIAELDRVARAGDRSPYAEEAHFDLGKAWLQLGNIAAARREFTTVIAMKGDLRAKAADLLSRVQDL